MFKRIFLWMQKYERHLSAFAMVAGFAADGLFFGRIDIWQTHLVFASYAVICFVAIPLLQWIETHAYFPRWRPILPLATQFALGGFWSGFVIFYGRSATFGVSWPFLLFLFLAFLGNEYFYGYHSRLVFTSVLFFFALYSYAIFAVPIYTGTIGTPTFLVSGAIALGIFALFTVLLRVLVRERFLVDVWRIRFGAFLVLIVVNASYFTGILPPLPLSAEATGVYHSVSRISGVYRAESEENQSWKVRYLGFAPTLHTVSGEFLYAYSSIFAPTALATTITHRWQKYDSMQEKWITKTDIPYPIVGGRDGGYRGYTLAQIDEAGQWRIDVETADGRLIARMPFTIEQTATSVSRKTFFLK